MYKRQREYSSTNQFVWVSYLYADDIVLIQENENDLQRAMLQLQEVARAYSLTISVRTTKTMAFKGKYLVRTKISAVQ